MTVTMSGHYFRSVEPAPELPVRKGARVLTSDPTLGYGVVEGMAYRNGYTLAVVRWDHGPVTRELTGVLVALYTGTQVVADQGNNLGRRCSVRGDGAAGEPVRVWRVVSAVSGHRYLVAHQRTSKVRVVSSRDMTNLY